MSLNCRFYENNLPEVGDVVVAEVKYIHQMGTYVDLLEYKNICGLVLHSELSRRRIRSVNRILRVGANVELCVVRVDSDKCYIDLSKRRAVPEEIVKCKERYAKAKSVYQILRNVAEKLKYETEEQQEELFRKTAWYFDKKTNQKAGSYDVFKSAVTNPSVLDECDIDEETREILLTNIKHRLTPKAVRIRARFEVSCFTYEGVDAVIRALNSGLKMSTDALVIKIKLIAPPLYVLTTQTMDRMSGLEHLNNVLEVIKKSIEEQGGSFKIDQAPRLVSDTDEADLQRHLDELEKANREVSGDDDDDEDDDDDDDEDEDDDLNGNDEEEED